MLKIFFNRFSKIVYAMEIVGVVLTLLWAFKAPPKILFTLYVGGYLLLRVCATWRWHKQAKRYEGIELHFKKVMVLVSYMLPLASGIGLATGSTFLLWTAVILFAAILHVNVILLYLHYKDKNKTPINYFSRNKFHNAGC